MKTKTTHDKPFKATILEVFEDRFLYYRNGNKRDKWHQAYVGALPNNLKVKVGETYTARNVIESDTMFKSWRIEYKEIK